MNNNYEPPKGIGDKLRSSLSLKLNMQMFVRLFSAFIAINVLLCLLFFGTAIYKAEKGAVNIVNAIEANEDYKDPMYTLIRVEEQQKGSAVLGLVYKLSPLKEPNASRQFSFDGNEEDIKGLRAISLIKYNIELLVRDKPYKITYSLGNELIIYLYLLIILMIFELIFLIGGIRKSSKATRKILRPISDMAETARNLNAQSASWSGANIKDLEGAISSIDATRLDKGLSVANAQNELKGIASAINAMLKRIDEAYRSQTRFVSDASHELRTPISVIQGYVNLLDRWGKNDEKTTQEAIDAIKSEAENMKDLVEQLLFLARGDSETMNLQMEVFDVSETARMVIAETQMIDPSHTLKWEGTEGAFINADKQLIKQAIRIFMDNSIKYTPTGEEISLKVIKDDKNVRISVTDNGIGIEDSDINHIFDRFFRSDESRARKTGGAGLGLSIAKWIIERHRGYVEVVSRKDIGTKVTMIIPSVNAPIVKTQELINV